MEVKELDIGVVKSLKENGGLDQMDIKTLKEISSLDITSNKYKGLFKTIFLFVGEEYNGYHGNFGDCCFTQFLKDNLKHYNKDIFENTNNLVNELDFDSVNKIIEMYVDYYKNCHRHDIDPMDIKGFVEYILENLSEVDVSSIEIREDECEYDDLDYYDEYN